MERSAMIGYSYGEKCDYGLDFINYKGIEFYDISNIK